MTKPFTRRILLLGATVVTASSPVTVGARGLQVQEAACQDGTCCSEDRATCVVGTHAEKGYYYKAYGSCGLIAT